MINAGTHSSVNFKLVPNLVLGKADVKQKPNSTIKQQERLKRKLVLCFCGTHVHGIRWQQNKEVINDSVIITLP